MSLLRKRLEAKIPLMRNERAAILKQYGERRFAEITVAQAYNGLKGVRALICDTSQVEKYRGLIIRGIPVGELKERHPEEIFFLLLTGEMPNASELASLRKEMASYSEVPDYVFSVLESIPRETHPMCMLSTCIQIMERDSSFRSSYVRGLHKDEMWIPMLEDALKIVSRVPTIAARIYRYKYDHGAPIPRPSGLDMAESFAKMLGIEDPDGQFTKLIRLYLTLHCDHENGNVSAHACHVVGSALSDAFYAIPAGLNGLAGPLHGLANQESFRWILALMERFKGVPTPEQVRELAFDMLENGRVIPGYGHAVLQVVDPRFLAFYDFGKRYLEKDPVFQTVETVYLTMPQVLKEYSEERLKQGRNPVTNIWPNVDAASGALLYHYGIKEFEYNTVVFSASRVLGLAAQLVLNRALSTPIVRPRSISTASIWQEYSA